MGEMYKCDLKAYEGNWPYIFASYCRRDSIRVYEILERLYLEGYRIWMDTEGIPQTAENWEKELKGRIAKSRVFMVFVSRAYFESRNCMNEVGWYTELAASDNRKRMSIIMLEDIPDAEWSGSVQPYVKHQRLEYGADTSIEYLLGRICGSELDVCKGPSRQPLESRLLKLREELLARAGDSHDDDPAEKEKRRSMTRDTVSEICIKMPKDLDELGKITGIGNFKLRTFGEEILAIIRDYNDDVEQALREETEYCRLSDEELRAVWPNFRKRWHKEDEQKLTGMFLDDEGMENISRELGREPVSCLLRLMQLSPGDEALKRRLSSLFGSFRAVRTFSERSYFNEWLIKYGFAAAETDNDPEDDDNE
ncbi:MAG: TIR domain-containing protein [Ruminococcus sp.]|nr:TIR domain-containing protein [Ruminococcus sp.]